MIDQPLSEYAQVRRRTPASVRDVARNAVLELLSCLPLPMDRPRVHMLYLHHVLRDEASPFRALLSRLARTHVFISYSEAIRRIYTGPIDKPYIAFSFDDGLKNCLDAASILEEYGASACFFVCDSMADNPQPEVARAFCEREISLPRAEFLTWHDMEQLQRRGHEIGNHSARHKTLAHLSRSELEDDIAGSLDRLRRRLDNVTHFAWPRGLFSHMSREAADIVYASGHASCASAERGAHVTPTGGVPEEVCIRREKIVAAAPLRQNLFFIGKSSITARPQSNLWPAA